VTEVCLAWSKWAEVTVYKWPSIGISAAVSGAGNEGRVRKATIFTADLLPSYVCLYSLVFTLSLVISPFTGVTSSIVTASDLS